MSIKLDLACINRLSVNVTETPNVNYDFYVNGTAAVSSTVNLASQTASAAVVTDASKNLSTRAILNNTEQGALGWDSAGASNANNLRFMTVNTLAYWNGAYSEKSSNLSVLGTITTGTWHGTKIANDYIANPKVTIADNEISLGGSLAASTLVSSLGLSKAMRFIGIATKAITDGGAEDPTISGYSTKTAGDVVIDKESSREYVWSTTNKWELLGGDSSYKVTLTAVNSATAETTKATTFVYSVTLDENGVITVKTRPLDTSGTWSGNATTATYLETPNKTVSPPSGVTLDDSNKALYGLQSQFSTTEKDKITAYSLSKGSRQMAIGYFLSGNSYNAVDKAYGGWYVISYTDPYYVSISNGTWAQLKILTDHNYSSYALPLSGGTITGQLITTSGGIWVQGGSAAGSDDTRMALTSGMPDMLPYNKSKRGVFIYSNAIAFADPLNGNSNNDAGWIRHLEANANSGTLEIAVGDDGSNEQIVVRRYNTSNEVSKEIKLFDASGNSSFPGILTLSNTTASTATNKGALVVSGGVGVGGLVTATRLAANGSNTSYNLYVNGNSLFNIGTSDTTADKKVTILGNNRLLSLGASGILAYSTETTVSILNLQYYGGNLQIGTSSTASATRDFYGVFNFKSANGFTYSGIGTGSDNTARPIWFSYNGIIGRPVYDNDFKYNPSTNTLTIGSGTLSETEYSGNAATATAIETAGTTAQFYRGDNSWSNTIKLTANAALGVDTNLKIGTARKDLNFDIATGSGTGINDGYAGGITWGTGAAAHAGIYYLTSGSYGTRLIFGTTTAYASGAYARMIIQNNGNVGIGTLSPDTLLTVNGNAKATNFIGDLNGNADTASKISAKLDQTHKTYLLGTQTTITGTAANVSLTGDTGVYLTTTAGELSAYRYSWHYGSVEKVHTEWNDIDESLDFIFA